MSWRTGCIAFALLSAFLAWRSWTRARPAPTAAACAALAAAHDERADAPRAADDPWATDRAPRGPAQPRAGSGAGAEGEEPGVSLAAPALLLGLAPRPDEDLLHYRDRVVPIVQQAIAPERARVARGRESFAAAAGLDARQQAELDAAVSEAAEAIQDRIFEGVLGGDLNPQRFKPMAGVGAARDILDSVDRANRRFLAALREDQRATLARHPFDLADYLLFSYRWEDAVGYSP